MNQQVYLAARTTTLDGYTQVWGPYAREYVGSTTLRIVDAADFVEFSQESRPVPNGEGGTVQGDFVRMQESR